MRSISVISPVSSSAALYAGSVAAPHAQPAKQSPPQDTVHISPQALAAAGADADHDGDSH